MRKHVNARNQAEKADVERTGRKQLWFQYAPITHVVQKVEKEPKVFYHKNFVPQRCCGLRNKSNLTVEKQNETRQVCGLVTKKGQGKPAERRKREHLRF